MNKIQKVLSALIISLLIMSFTKPTLNVEQKIQGTFIGLDDDGFFTFKIDDKKTMIFHEQDDELEISLYDQDNEGKKFEVTWQKAEIEEYDDEGETNGESFSGKRIIHLKEI